MEMKLMDNKILLNLESFISNAILHQNSTNHKISSVLHQSAEQGGGRTRLPKFKFSEKFPIGLHVILQIQIKKFENDCYIMWKIILTENPSRFNVEPLLK